MRVAKFDTQAKVFQPLPGGIISKLDVSPSTFFYDHTVLISMNSFAPHGILFFTSRLVFLKLSEYSYSPGSVSIT